MPNTRFGPTNSCCKLDVEHGEPIVRPWEPFIAPGRSKAGSKRCPCFTGKGTQCPRSLPCGYTNHPTLEIELRDAHPEWPGGVLDQCHDKLFTWASAKPLSQLLPLLDAPPVPLPTTTLEWCNLLVVQARAKEHQRGLCMGPNGVWVTNFPVMWCGSGSKYTLGWKQEDGEAGWRAVGIVANTKQWTPQQLRILALHKDVVELARVEDYAHDATRRSMMVYTELLDSTLQDRLDGLLTDTAQSYEPLLFDVARGVAALHAAGFVHTNISPDTVFLKEGKAKLGDVRTILRCNGDSDEAVACRKGSSRIRRSPEQHAHANWAKTKTGCRPAVPGAASDVYQFGLLMLEVLLGGKNSSNILRNLAAGQKLDDMELKLQLLGSPEAWPVVQLPGEGGGEQRPRPSCRGVLAFNLVRSMLQVGPEQRPTMAAVLAHPFWWHLTQPQYPQRTQYPGMLFHEVKNWMNTHRSCKDSERRARHDACFEKCSRLVLSCAQGKTTAGQWAVPGPLLRALVDPSQGKKGAVPPKWTYNFSCLFALVRFVRNGLEHWGETLRTLGATCHPLAKQLTDTHTTAVPFQRFMMNQNPALLLALFVYAFQVEKDKLASTIFGISNVADCPDFSPFASTFLEEQDQEAFTSSGVEKLTLSLQKMRLTEQGAAQEQQGHVPAAAAQPPPPPPPPRHAARMHQQPAAVGAY